MVQARRSLKVIRNRVGPSATQLADAKRILSGIENTSIALAEAQRSMTELSSQLEALMKESGLQTLEGSVLSAAIAEDIGRSSTYIDPLKFRKLVTEKDFLSSVSIAVASAKKVLTQKEYDSIAVVTEGENRGKKLFLKPVKTRTRT